MMRGFRCRKDNQDEAILSVTTAMIPFDWLPSGKDGLLRIPSGVHRTLANHPLNQPLARSVLVIVILPFNVKMRLVEVLSTMEPGIDRIGGELFGAWRGNGDLDVGSSDVRGPS